MQHGPACLMLGTMNLYGNGVPVDYDAALTWMRKALATKDTRVKTSAEMVREASFLSQLTALSLFAPILKIPYLLCRFSLPSRASPSLHFGTKTPPDFSEPPNPLALSSVPIDPKVITRSIAPTCYSIFSTCVAPPASHLLQERCPKTSTAPPSSTTGPSFPAMSSTAALPSLCLKGRPPRGP